MGVIGVGVEAGRRGAGLCDNDDCSAALAACNAILFGTSALREMLTGRCAAKRCSIHYNRVISQAAGAALQLQVINRHSISKHLLDAAAGFPRPCRHHQATMHVEPTRNGCPAAAPPTAATALENAPSLPCPSNEPAR